MLSEFKYSKIKFCAPFDAKTFKGSIYKFRNYYISRKELRKHLLTIAIKTNIEDR